VDDLKAVEVAPWARLGGNGAFVYVVDEDAGSRIDAYVVDIPPGGSLNPQRHIFEAMVYVVEGNGSTAVWYDDNRKVSFEWQAGSLFAIPINASYRHFNGSGSKPARLFVVTDAPLVMNLFHNLGFVFENPYRFEDRFAGQDNYFDGEAIMHKGNTGRTFVLETNFVPDTSGIELHSWKERGAGGRSVFFELAHNTMAAHISQFPVGTYKKAHRHGGGAHVIILSGQGYTLLWPEGAEPIQVDWRRDALVVPPAKFFHQHFNTGREPARYLALRWGSQRYEMGGRMGESEGDPDVSVKEGGWQIEYEDEDRRIHERFEADLARSGAVCRMREMVAWCTGPAEAAERRAPEGART
jgi:quercetin dioxygenase-like cupin family protein